MGYCEGCGEEISGKKSYCPDCLEDLKKDKSGSTVRDLRKQKDSERWEQSKEEREV